MLAINDDNVDCTGVEGRSKESLAQDQANNIAVTTTPGLSRKSVVDET